MAVMDLFLVTLFVVTKLVVAFNSDDNINGYNGECPKGWRYNDHMCYRERNYNRNFREALRECTSHRDNYHMYWDQGSRWIGPRYNLMPVEMLHTLLEHDARKDKRIGRGPYRVNAIKTGHDHEWLAYDGGDLDFDFYRWRGGRKVDFSMFPEFDVTWGSAGDTLVWYPHKNKLYTRPHYHEYDSLCWRRKQDAERCPGEFSCSFHGDCYHGKCYCYEGWHGEDCSSTAKILSIGGVGDYVSPYDVELFDMATGESCYHSEFPEIFYRGEAAVLNGDVFACHASTIDSNGTHCYSWQKGGQRWVSFSPDSLSIDMAHAAAVVVPRQGWWWLGGNGNDPDIHNWRNRTQLLVMDDRRYFRYGPRTPTWRGNHCAVQITDYRTAMVGGTSGDDIPGSTTTPNNTDDNMIQIYDWSTDRWYEYEFDTAPGRSTHTCQLLMDPKCGHPTVVMVGGVNVYDSTPTREPVTHVLYWDTITDEISEGHENPDEVSSYWKFPQSVRLDEHTMVVTGGAVGSFYGSDGIWKYTIEDGFTKIGEMIRGRKQHASVLVWGDEYQCDPDFDGFNGGPA